MVGIDDLLLVAASARAGVVLARAQSRRWETEAVLRDQDVRCLAANPTDGRTLYSGTQGSGVFRSTDGGASWSHAGLAGQIIKSLAVSPTDDRTVYAGAKPPMVFVSRDRGDSWEELKSFRGIPGRSQWRSPAEPPGTAYVQSLAVSPTEPQVILAGIELGAVVRSADGGATWSRHLRGTLRDCHSLIFHPRDGNWAYEAGGTGGGASLSRDGGTTWTKVGEGLDRHYAVACAADPDRPGVWYISASPGPGKAHSGGNAEAALFRAQDGAGWVKLTGGLPQPIESMPYGLATVPGRSGLVITGLQNGEVWASEDIGESWSHLSVQLGPIRPGLLAIPRST